MEFNLEVEAGIDLVLEGLMMDDDFSYIPHHLLERIVRRIYPHAWENGYESSIGKS